MSELALFNELLDDIPKGYIMLMDDLYNSYEIMNKCFLRNIHFVVPAKRKRNFKVIRPYAKEDFVKFFKIFRELLEFSKKAFTFAPDILSKS